jgi:hypothetical protein
MDVDCNKHGSTGSKQREGEQAEAEQRMVTEGDSGGCKQARSRSSVGRKEEKRLLVPPMTISASVLLRSEVQTVAAGSNQHGPPSRMSARDGRKPSYRPGKGPLNYFMRTEDITIDLRYVQAEFW